MQEAARWRKVGGRSREARKASVVSVKSADGIGRVVWEQEDSLGEGRKRAVKEGEQPITFSFAERVGADLELGEAVRVEDILDGGGVKKGRYSSTMASSARVDAKDVVRLVILTS